MEVWKDIPGYEGLYQVSNHGRVKRGAYIKKTRIARNGYVLVSLWKDGNEKKCLVHRLVADAFIDNSSGLPEVNHKDENKANNHVSNLEWCTRTYNLGYGTRRERFQKSRGKRVVQYTIDGVFIARYVSAQEAAKQTGIYQSAISNACNGVYKQANGYLWRYETNRAQ